MADQKVSALPPIPVVDRSADQLYIVDVSAGTSNKVSPNTLLGIAGNPVGDTDSQTLTNKTVGNTNAITQKAGVFTLQDDTDTTKQAQFSLAALSSGVTRIFTLPNGTSTLVSTGATQTLTNKTLTSPTINTATIVNPTITADSIAGFSSSTTGTIFGASIASGVVASAALLNSVNTAAIQSNAVDYTKVANGMVVQIVSTNYSAVATGTNLIPNDDTIPQITEGTEFMTQAITPKSATNRLFIEAKIFIASTSNANKIAALFQDATANALAAQSVYIGGFGDGVGLYITHDMVAGTTSPTTFRVRGGGDVAGTFTFNGSASARKFGGVSLSTIKITEYKA